MKIIMSKRAGVYRYIAALYVGLFAILFAVSPAGAGSPTLLGVGKASGGGGGLDPATTAWVSAVTTAGGTVSAPRQTIVNTFIVCLKTASLFTVLDRYWLLAGEDAGSANVDMANLQPWTPHGTFTFSANNGYTGDGSSGYGDTGYIPSSGGGHIAQDSATIGVQIQTNRSAGANMYAFGADDAGAFSKIIMLLPSEGSGNFGARVNSSSLTGSTAPASVRHSWLLSRTGASAVDVYVDGGNYTTQATPSSGLPTTSLYFGALNFNGPFGYSTDQVSSFYFGGGMDSTQVTAFESCQNAMMTSVGISVH